MACPRGCCPDYRTHLTSLSIAPDKSPQGAREKVLGNDLDAYQRLVKSGVQPKGIDGAAELERFASTTHEVEHRNVITDPKLRAKVTRAFAESATPSITPLDAA